MKRTILIAITVMALVFGLVAYAAAATDSKTVTVTAAVPNVFSMTIDNATVNFAIVNPEAATAGSNGVKVSLKSNKLLDLTYTMSQFADAGSLTMPQTVMSYVFNGGASTAAAASGTLGTNLARGNTDYTNTFTIQPGLQYDPASYTSSLIYTAVQK